MQLIDRMCGNSIVATRLIEARLGVARPTALRIPRQMDEGGLREPGTHRAGGQRPHVARESINLVTAGHQRGTT